MASSRSAKTSKTKSKKGKTAKQYSKPVSIKLHQGGPTSTFTVGKVLSILDQAFRTQPPNQTAFIAHQLISAQPTLIEAYTPLFALLDKAGDHNQLEALSKSCLSKNPKAIPAMQSLSVALRRRQAHEDALSVLQKAEKLEPTNVTTLNQLGITQKEMGKLEDALQSFNRCIALQPNFIQAYWNRADLYKNISDDDTQQIEKLLKSSNLKDLDRARLHYALSRAYEYQKHYALSFSQMQQGATLKRKTLSFNLNEALDELASIQEHFSPELFQQPAPVQQGSRPIFICGLPRSGTTLTEHILSSHPDVVAGDEMIALMQSSAKVLQTKGIQKPFPLWAKDFTPNDWQAIAQAYLSATKSLQTGKYFTDKMMMNYKAVGVMRMAFPHAKIIHCLRHPLDNIMGCFKQLFGDGLAFTYDLDELTDIYIGYRKLMQYWTEQFPNHIYNVQYEDVVNNIDETVKQLLEFLDLPWHEGCLNFHENTRPVQTTSSIQVRQPLFKSNMGSWLRYEDQLQPYAERLNDWI